MESWEYPYWTKFLVLHGQEKQRAEDRGRPKEVPASKIARAYWLNWYPFLVLINSYRELEDFERRYDVDDYVYLGCRHGRYPRIKIIK